MNPFITDLKMSPRAEVRATVTDAGVATIRLYDPIDSWGGPFGVSAKEFVSVLDALPDDTSEVTVLINCPGGEVWEGMAIYNSLRSHKARVVTIVEGLAASAASFIAMAGDEVIMRPASELMIHDAWIVGIGNADGLREIADRIDAETMIIAEIYAEKAGTPVDMWREAMRNETWFSPSEAVESGLADRVESGVAASAASANRFNLSTFNYACRHEAPAPAVPKTSSALAEGNRGKENSMADLMNELRQRLGVSDVDADEGALLAALDEALEERADDEPKEPADENEGQPDSERDAEPEGAGKGPDDAEQVVLDREVYAELLTRAERGDAADQQATHDEADRLVSAAVDDGRLAAASRDRWVRKILDDPEDAKPRLASMASGRINRNEVGRGGSDIDNDQADHSRMNADADRSGIAARPKL